MTAVGTLGFNMLASASQKPGGGTSFGFHLYGPPKVILFLFSDPKGLMPLQLKADGLAFVGESKNWFRRFGEPTILVIGDLVFVNVSYGL